MKKEAKRQTPLQNKHRPSKLKGVFGQKEAVSRVEELLKSDNRPNTILLEGPRGCGKTTVSRILARKLGAKHTDLVVLDIGHTGGKDRAREISEDANYSPMYGDAKVFILEECHRANKDFQDALLLTTEEPPENVYFILCTTDAERLNSTILSRSRRIRFKSLSIDALVEAMNRILKKEKKKIKEKKLHEIAYAADGDCRFAIDLLSQVIDGGEKVELYVGVKKDSRKLSRSLLRFDNWKAVSSILTAFGKEDIEQVRQGVLTYMEKVLLDEGGDKCDRACDIIASFEREFYSSGRAGLAAVCYDLSTIKKAKK